jgi:GTP cyclohydrolase I
MTKNRKYKKDVENILLTLGMDLTDDIKGTPNRVAKMFVKEILGLNPKASTFDNNYKVRRNVS